MGDEFGIAVDANQGWRVALVDDAPLWTIQHATDFAHACVEFGVAWIEEPLDMYAYDELAELRQRTEVPIAGAELNSGWHEFKVMLEKGSYDIYQPDATMGGGIGFSINSRVKIFKDKQGRESIEDIVKLKSVDLVASPALTGGLFESVQRNNKKLADIYEAKRQFLGIEDEDIQQAMDREAFILAIKGQD